MTSKNQKSKIKNQKLPKLSKKPGLSKSPKASRSPKSPQTMEELIKLYGEKVKGFKRGEEVEGKVMAITSKSIYFDIGGKTEGVVLGREFLACREFVKTLKIGDKVNLRVGNPENERGQILLNLRKAAHKHAWKFLKEKLKSGQEVEVRGKELNRGGLVVSTPFNFSGFVPSSQLGAKWQDRHQSLINRVLKVKVIEVNRKDNRLVFSERLVSEADKIAAEEKLLKKIKTGENYEGRVLQVLPHGLMVEIKVAREEKLPGLVHISEVSWSKVEDLNKFYKAGDNVKVKVLKIEVPLAGLSAGRRAGLSAGRQVGQASKLQLSIKQLQPDPWQDLGKKYPADTSVKGVVKRLEAYGAIIEISPGIEGLLHISKIPPEYKIDVGDKTSCFIESVDIKNRKISLGLVLKKKPVGYK